MKSRVLFVSGHGVSYMRNRVLLTALRTHFDVTVLTPNLASIPGRTFVGLARSIACRSDHDICFAGSCGQPIAIGVSMLQHKPIVLDACVSTSDTFCEDRRRFHSDSILGRLARWLDQRSSHLAAHVLTDTQAHAHERTWEKAWSDAHLVLQLTDDG